MKKIVLILSILGLIFNFIEATNYNLQWGFGLRNFDLDTLFGISILSLVFYIILLLLKIQNRKTTAILLGSSFGFYKAINLYNLSHGAFGVLSLFGANHTITITLSIIIVTSTISLVNKKA